MQEIGLDMETWAPSQQKIESAVPLGPVCCSVVDMRILETCQEGLRRYIMFTHTTVSVYERDITRACVLQQLERDLSDAAIEVEGLLRDKDDLSLTVEALQTDLAAERNLNQEMQSILDSFRDQS